MFLFAIFSSLIHEPLLQYWQVSFYIVQFFASLFLFIQWKKILEKQWWIVFCSCIDFKRIFMWWNWYKTKRKFFVFSFKFYSNIFNMSHNIKVCRSNDDWFFVTKSVGHIYHFLYSSPILMMSKTTICWGYMRRIRFFIQIWLIKITFVNTIIQNFNCILKIRDRDFKQKS